MCLLSMWRGFSQDRKLGASSSSSPCRYSRYPLPFFFSFLPYLIRSCFLIKFTRISSLLRLSLFFFSFFFCFSIEKENLAIHHHTCAVPAAHRLIASVAWCKTTSFRCTSRFRKFRNAIRYAKLVIIALVSGGGSANSGLPRQGF